MVKNGDKSVDSSSSSGMCRTFMWFGAEMRKPGIKFTVVQKRAETENIGSLKKAFFGNGTTLQCGPKKFALFEWP